MVEIHRWFSFHSRSVVWKKCCPSIESERLQSLPPLQLLLQIRSFLHFLVSTIQMNRKWDFRYDFVICTDLRIVETWHSSYLWIQNCLQYHRITSHLSWTCSIGKYIIILLFDNISRIKLYILLIQCLFCLNIIWDSMFFYCFWMNEL